MKTQLFTVNKKYQLKYCEAVSKVVTRLCEGGTTEAIYLIIN